MKGGQVAAWRSAFRSLSIRLPVPHPRVHLSAGWTFVPEWKPPAIDPAMQTPHLGLLGASLPFHPLTLSICCLEPQLVALVEAVLREAFG